MNSKTYLVLDLLDLLNSNVVSDAQSGASGEVQELQNGFTLRL